VRIRRRDRSSLASRAQHELRPSSARAQPIRRQPCAPFKRRRVCARLEVRSFHDSGSTRSIPTLRRGSVPVLAHQIGRNSGQRFGRRSGARSINPWGHDEIGFVDVIRRRSRGCSTSSVSRVPHRSTAPARPRLRAGGKCRGVRAGWLADSMHTTMFRYGSWPAGPPSGLRSRTHWTPPAPTAATPLLRGGSGADHPDWNRVRARPATDAGQSDCSRRRPHRRGCAGAVAPADANLRTDTTTARTRPSASATSASRVRVQPFRSNVNRSGGDHVLDRRASARP